MNHHERKINLKNIRTPCENVLSPKNRFFSTLKAVWTQLNFTVRLRFIISDVISRILKIVVTYENTLRERAIARK